MRLFLVRHGESTWNAVRRWQGRADPPLSARGEQQAIDAGRYVGTVTHFDGVVTSSLRRAHRTGELLAAGLGVELLEPVVDLGERGAGDWEGLTRIEIEARFPGFLDDGRRPPGYEPDDAVVARATTALLALATRTPRARSDRADGSLLVVTHGGVIHALERRATEEWQRLDNLEGRWFEVEPHERTVTPTGDRIHLLRTPPGRRRDRDGRDGGDGRGPGRGGPEEDGSGDPAYA